MGRRTANLDWNIVGPWKEHFEELVHPAKMSDVEEAEVTGVV